MAVDQQPVQRHIGQHQSDGGVEGNPHPLSGAQQRAHTHGQDLHRIREAHHPQVIHADTLDVRLVRIDRHDPFRRKHAQTGKGDRHHHHEADGDAVGTVDALIVLRAPVLAEEQHAAAHKAPVTAEHQRRELRAQSDRTDGRFAQWGNHNRIHHRAGGGQQILQRNRNSDHSNLADEVQPGEGLLLHHSCQSFLECHRDYTRLWDESKAALHVRITYLRAAYPQCR